MRAIRAIMNEAKKAGAIKETHYTFGKYKYEYVLYGKRLNEQQKHGR
jgi:hypothetical protein